MDENIATSRLAINIDEGRLRPLRYQDLEMVLFWRNSERIRKSMFSTHIISLEEHRNWFANLDSERDIYMVFEQQERAVGMVYFNNIVKQGITRSTWGFYLGETDVPKGTGLLMGYLGVEYAFHVLNINMLYGEVLGSNQRSQRFHESLGFLKVDYEVNSIAKTSHYDDVILYELLPNRWQIFKPNLG